MIFLFKFAHRKLIILSLKILNLTKKYGSQTALNAINLEIGANEIVGLLGPNGAGKSTLMKSITGALTPDDGEIFFNGKNIAEFPLETKAKMGFLPENNPLYNDMFVREYLDFVADVRKVSRKRIDEIIALTGITPEKSKKTGQLSKGYRQRVGLAASILHEPELLILDEPTNGLDPNQILEIREVIRNVGSGKSVILSTHIMQEVEALCTRVILLNKGSIVQDCAVQDFKGRFRSLEEAFAEYTMGGYS